MNEVSRSMLRVSVVALCVAALIAIAALLSGDFDETEGKICLTTLMVALYNLTGMAAAAARTRPELAVLGAFALAASGIGLALGIYLTWSEWEEDDVIHLWGIVTTAAISLAQAGLLLIRRRASDGKLVRIVLAATLVLVGILAVLIAGAIASGDDPDEGYFRFLGVIAVLDVLGTLLLPILRRLQGDARSPTAESEPMKRGDLVRALGLEQDAAGRGEIFMLPRGDLEARVELARDHGADVLQRGTTAAGGAFALLRADGQILALVERD
jgi:hypothetical protein